MTVEIQLMPATNIIILSEMIAKIEMTLCATKYCIETGPQNTAHFIDQYQNHK